MAGMGQLLPSDRGRVDAPMVRSPRIHLSDNQEESSTVAIY